MNRAVLFCRWGLFLLTVVLLAGCSEPGAPNPPSSRAELTGRLFEALQHKRDQEALVIIGKLLALDPDDAELMEMRDRVTVNACTRQVQKLIDNGQIDQALQIVRRYRKDNSTLPGLRVLEAELNELILLRNSSQALAEADNISELVTQLEKIAPLAAKYPQAKQLQQDIQLRRKQLAQMRAAAAAKTQADAPAADSAAK